MPRSFTPLRYPGGKSQFYDNVVRILTFNNIQHATYIEAFAGGAGVAIRLLLEGLVDNIIINDIDPAIYSFWHTVVHNNKWLIDKINDTKITIEEWNHQKDIYLNYKQHSVKEVGFATLFLNRCNRSGILSAGPIGGKNQIGNYKIDCRFNKNNIISIIQRIGFYKNRIKVYKYDATLLIKKMKNVEGAFWFIDPPYYVKGEELYKNSFSHNDHVRLSKVIKKELVDVQWILTYDVCDEIYNLYNSYKHAKILLSYSVEKKRKEYEFLFFNNLCINNEVLRNE